MYEDFIYNARYYFPILTFIVFASLLFDKESRFSSIVLVCVCIIFFLMPDINTNQSKEAYKADFTEALYVAMSYNVAAMLALMYRINPVAKKQALLFACVIFLNIMVSLKLIHGFHWWNFYFVDRYNEILILIAILQIGYSKDGMVRICGRIGSGVSKLYFRRRSFSGIPHAETKRIQTGSQRT